MHKLRDNLATVVAALVVAGVLVAAFVLLKPQAAGGTAVAVVHDGEGATYTLPLDTDDTLTVATSLGTNTVAVQDGAVRMADADCPKGSCLEQHPISRPGEQIICLPHRLWVEVVEDGASGSGSRMDEDAVTWDGVDLVAQ